MIQRLLAKANDNHSESSENTELKSEEHTLPSSPIQIAQSLSEAALDVQNDENDENHENGQEQEQKQEADAAESAEVKTESEPEPEPEPKEVVKLALDESSFCSILKTLDMDSLDKEGSGHVSCHYVRYFFKTKLSRHVADEHVLKVLQHVNGGAARSVSTAKFKAWRAQMTSYSLEKILRSELVMHTKLAGSSSSQNVGHYLLDQTSLFLFLKSIEIKHINDDSGYTKLFDFGVFLRRHYDDYQAVADKDAANKIFADIDAAQQGRITNEQYNVWIAALSEARLDEIIE